MANKIVLSFVLLVLCVAICKACSGCGECAPVTDCHTPCTEHKDCPKLREKVLKYCGHHYFHLCGPNGEYYYGKGCKDAKKCEKYRKKYHKYCGSSPIPYPLPCAC